MFKESNDGSDELRTKKEKRDCAHCGEFHTVEVVTEPGWERVVFCPQTGVVG